MNTKDIEKREELCRLLNMNFDETTELFSDETMQSMQMAQVNGGIWWKILEVLVVAGVTYIVGQCTESDERKTIPAPSLPPDFIERIMKEPSDSTFYRVHPDGSYELKKYGTGEKPLGPCI